MGVFEYGKDPRPGRRSLPYINVVTPASVRPLTGHLPHADRTAAVDDRLDHREDRALQCRGGDDLTPAAVLVTGVGRIVVARGQLPHLLEHQTRESACAQAQHQVDRLEGDLLDLRAHL